MINLQVVGLFQIFVKEHLLSMYLAKEQRKKKRLAFYQSSVVASPESSPYYPPVLRREADSDMSSKNDGNTPPKLHKEMATLSSSCESSPCLPPPAKKAKPLSFSDESPSSSQTNLASTANTEVVDFRAVQQRVQFLSEAFPEIPKQVTELFGYLCGRSVNS